MCLKSFNLPGVLGFEFLCVGVSVVNALSEKLKLEIYRDGNKHFIEFQSGEAKAPLKVIGKTKHSGTQITFLPSKEIFSSHRC